MKISVIMPMYNAKNIANVLKETVLSLEKFTKDYEIILVNDGSTNDCAKDARKFRHKKIKIVGYEKNAGKGNAIRYGFKFANGKYIAFLDSGGEFDAFQLKNFMEIMHEKNADAVIGSKRHPQSVVHYPLMRRLLSAAYQYMNRLLFNLNVKDTQVGIKLFKREVLEKVMPKILVKKFAFDLELLVVINKLKFKIIEAPIVMRYKFESTVDLKAVSWILLDTMAIFYRLKILKWYDRK